VWVTKNGESFVLQGKLLLKVFGFFFMLHDNQIPLIYRIFICSFCKTQGHEKLKYKIETRNSNTIYCALY